MIDFWREFWSNQPDWLKDLIINLTASAIFLAIIFIFKLPQRLYKWIRRHRKIALAKTFPFDIVKPSELGKRLMDNKKLSCYENEFVPKKVKTVYESETPGHPQRRIYVGGSQTGKTRTAYKWILDIARDRPVDILIPKKDVMPDLINKDELPTLEKTVILFYDDINKSLFSESEETHSEGEGCIISPLERFEENINFLKPKFDNFYVVCTLRWEREVDFKLIKNPRKIWKTFDILTLEDASQEDEFKMIKSASKYFNIGLSDIIAKEMVKINGGCSYENTIEFMGELQKNNVNEITEQMLANYKKKISDRWKENVFYKLEEQNPLVSQIVGAMYALKFELGLPLYKEFILTSAKIVTNGFFKELRLQKAMQLFIEKDVFRMDGNIVSCSDYMLEIEGKKTPSRDDCLNSLYNRKSKLSQDEQNSLTVYYFNNGVAFYEKGEIELSAKEWEKSIILKPDSHEAYNNWGVTLSDLAKLRNYESLYEQSIEKYQKAVEIKPDKHEAYNNWGVALYDLAKLKNDESLYKQSFEKYLKAVEFKPDYQDAYSNWGNALYGLAKLKNDESLYKQSFEKYRKAVEIKSDFHEAYYNWGVAISALAKLKNNESLYNQSFEKFLKAVEIKPDKHEAYSNWGSALYALAKLKNNESLYEQSFEKYQKAVEIKPDYHEAYYNWGVAISALAKLKNNESLYKQSIEKYQKAVEIKPDKHEAYNNWGAALSYLAKLNNDESLYEQSFEKYQKAVEIKPDYHEAYNNWGAALSYLAKLNNDESLFMQGIEKFQKAVNINPKDESAYFNMACAYALMKRAKEACEFLDRAISVSQEVFNKVQTDSDFDPIRDDPIFQQWLQQHSKKEN